MNPSPWCARPESYLGTGGGPRLPPLSRLQSPPAEYLRGDKTGAPGAENCSTPHLLSPVEQALFLGRRPPSHVRTVVARLVGQALPTSALSRDNSIGCGGHVRELQPNIAQTTWKNSSMSLVTSWPTAEWHLLISWPNSLGTSPLKIWKADLPFFIMYVMSKRTCSCQLYEPYKTGICTLGLPPGFSYKYTQSSAISRSSRKPCQLLMWASRRTFRDSVSHAAIMHLYCSAPACCLASTQSAAHIYCSSDDCPIRPPAQHARWTVGHRVFWNCSRTGRSSPQLLYGPGRPPYGQ